ncbi:MAG: sugar transferase [Patescibacteria group bacterium]
MKRSELILMFIQLPLDFLMLLLAGLTAYVVRFTATVISIRPPQFAFEQTAYLTLVAGVSAGWILIFAFSGLYRPDPNRKLANDLVRVFLACSTGLAAITVFMFFRGELFNSRFIVLAAWGFAVIFVIAGRLFMRIVRSILYRANIATKHIVVIGDDRVTEAILKTIKNRKGLGYFVRAHYPRFTSHTQNEIEELHAKHRIDELIFTNPKAREEEALEIVEFCTERHITFKYSADLFSTYVTNMDVSSIAGIPVIEMKKTRLDGWGRIIKRMVDFTLALIGAIIASPFMLLAALAIAIETGGPVIYRNERVGCKGETFNTLKFRTMHKKYCIGTQFKNSKEALEFEQQLIKEQNTKEGPLYKIKNDPRVTLVGRVLRRASIDELPQLFNVLGGSMSLVGPRPHQPREVEQYERHHKVVHDIRPGITGLAQISGRSDLSFEEEIRLDTFYMEHWSLLMDAIILLKTPFILLRKRKAL